MIRLNGMSFYLSHHHRHKSITFTSAFGSGIKLDIHIIVEQQMFIHLFNISADMREPELGQPIKYTFVLYLRNSLPTKNIKFKFFFSHGFQLVAVSHLQCGL